MQVPFSSFSTKLFFFLVTLTVYDQQNRTWLASDRLEDIDLDTTPALHAGFSSIRANPLHTEYTVHLTSSTYSMREMTKRKTHIPQPPSPQTQLIIRPQSKSKEKQTHTHTHSPIIQLLFFFFYITVQREEEMQGQQRW